MIKEDTIMNTRQQDGGRLSIFNDPTPKTLTAIDDSTMENSPLSSNAKTKHKETITSTFASYQKENQLQATSFVSEYIDLTIEIQNCLCDEPLDKPQYRVGGNVSMHAVESTSLSSS